jgi:hypothetical protein
MSQEELVAAYLDGTMGRRVFIRRLVAGGVSLAAAAAYSDHLAGVAAAASRHNESKGEHDGTTVDTRPPPEPPSEHAPEHLPPPDPPDEPIPHEPPPPPPGEGDDTSPATQTVKKSNTRRWHTALKRPAP